ncbi:hypothetical protein ALC53_10343 [Atta colombica]|uniref:Uncharacterized protein n=1 Tax=Atta colombica TaxID=520822 RepID=A0A195B4R6_9HYME|nr:hypothetical protein ALC53_10343 [Atta colombica]
MMTVGAGDVSGSALSVMQVYCSSDTKQSVYKVAAAFVAEKAKSVGDERDGLGIALLRRGERCIVLHCNAPHPHPHCNHAASVVRVCARGVHPGQASTSLITKDSVNDPTNYIFRAG